MRHADVSARAVRDAGGGAVPGGAHRRTIRTTRIPAPRLARQDGSAVLAAAGRRAAARARRRADVDESGPWLDARRAPALVLGIGDAVAVLVGYYLVILWVSPVRLSSWLELRRADGRRDVRGPAGDPQPGAVGRPHDLRPRHRAVAAGASDRPARPRDDRARPRHQAVLPRRGDLHRVRRRARRARRLAIDLPHLAGQPAQGRQLPAPRDHRRHRPARRAAQQPVPHPSRGRASASSGSSARPARPARQVSPTCGWPTTPTLRRCSTRRTSKASCCAPATSARRCSSCWSCPSGHGRVTSTSIRVCRASTSAACRPCRSRTSHCSTSSRRSLSRLQVELKRGFDALVAAAMLDRPVTA